MADAKLVFGDAVRRAFLDSEGESFQVRSLERLESVTSIHVYPDVTAEGRGIGVPCGVSFKTTGRDALVVPNGVTDPNDGFRLVKLPFKAWDLTPHAATLIHGLNGLRSPWRNISEGQLDRIFVEGIHMLGLLGIENGNDAQATYDNGCEPGASAEAPSKAVRSLLIREFGAYGTFSHFIEFACVAEEPVGSPDLEIGDVLMVIHGGTMRGGDRFYIDATLQFAEAALEVGGIDEELFVEGVFGLPVTHSTAQEFLCGAAAMSNAAYVWRSIIQHRIQRLVRMLGISDKPFELLSDIPHNRIRKHGSEIHYSKSAQPLYAPDGTMLRVPYVMCGYPGTQLYLFTSALSSYKEAHVSHGGVTLNLSSEHLASFKAFSYPELLTNRDGELPSLDVLQRQSSLAAAGYDEHLRAGLIRHIARLEPIANFRGDPKDNGFLQEKF